MRNLLSAGAVRLLRCKALWLSCLLMAVLEAATMAIRFREGMEMGYFAPIDGGFFIFAALAGITSALVCAMLIGPEYGDGAMRNKLVTGAKRRDVYLAGLVLSCLASLIMCLAAILPALAVGLPLLGGFRMGAYRAAVATLGVCAMSLAYASVFTLLMMLTENRAPATAAALVLAVALLAAGSALYNILSQPATIQGYQLSVNGQLVPSEPQPNPAYLPDGPLRQLVQFLNDFLPGGQAIQYADLSADRPWLLIACDAAVVLMTSALGLLLFRRKNIK